MDILCLWAIPLEPDKVNGEVVVIMDLFSEGCINLPPCSGILRVALELKAKSLAGSCSFWAGLGMEVCSVGTCAVCHAIHLLK